MINDGEKSTMIIAVEVLNNVGFTTLCEYYYLRVESQSGCQIYCYSESDVISY